MEEGWGGQGMLKEGWKEDEGCMDGEMVILVTSCMSMCFYLITILSPFFLSLKQFVSITLPHPFFLPLLQVNFSPRLSLSLLLHVPPSPTPSLICFPVGSTGRLRA